MFWADKFAETIIKTGKHKPYWVDDMKTPSGKIHVGALRGVVIHGLIYQALIEKGQKATYSYVINDMDPMDGFPKYLPPSFKKHMGEPLYRIPSPEKGYQSMARLYGEEFIQVFNQLGFKPKIIWSSQEYRQGKFDQVVKEALDSVEKVRQLYHDVSGYDKPKNWYPYQVICPQCGKVGTTMVTGWDGEKVSFECKKDLVKWAEGCGYQGKVEPKGDNGKLMWKVDWAAHWKIIGVTVEGAGKDHMSEGGSHDLSSAICEKVFNYPTPFGFIYEWFLAKGGVKMSSSKGVGVSAAEISQTLPPEILRFLMTKTDYKKAIIFDPNNNDSILDLFDDYDRSAAVYYQEEVKNPLGRAWQLAQINKPPKSLLFYPRFRDVVNYIQSPSVNLEQKFAEIKGEKLTETEQEELKKRVKYAEIWLNRYAPEEKKIGVVAEKVTVNLSDDQKKYLKLVSQMLEKKWQAEELQQELYETAKKNKINPKEAFQGIYLSLTGKKYGPKAAWFLLDQDKKLIQKRFSETITLREEKETVEYQYEVIDRPELLSIDQSVADQWPSMKIGMAVIKGVKNERIEFNEFKDKVLGQIQGISLDEINNARKILAIRKVFRESGMDWHKRRPTMEALLRRIAQGKDLYTINPLVDLGNLLVMKHQLSLGVFNLKALKVPMVMKLSSGGEKVQLVGAKEPMELKKGEICYFDQEGPFVVDICWRDAERTGVDKNSTDILLLSEAMGEITRKELEMMLDDSIKTIIKYCGGKLETAGIVTAK